MWMACLSPETFEMAGTYGHNLLLGSVFGLSPELAVQRRKDYYRGLVQGGHSVEDKQVGCLMMVYVAETKEQAEAEYRDACQWYFNTIAKYVSVEGDTPVKSYEMYNAFRDVAAVADFDKLADGGFVICGSPDQVVERLTEAQDVYGMTELLCWTRLGGLDNNKVLKSMELMRDKVFPYLRDLTPPPPPEFDPAELVSA
jgi:alkanesulfonate monooxygenase SsuD/methylene tetrahydromethanopterin reductase-like flavin-dependent oxidoreductase (luciferase family)